VSYKSNTSNELAASTTDLMQVPVGAYVGDVIIRDRYDLLYYNLVTSITGDLLLKSANCDVVLPNLTSISGTLSTWYGLHNAGMEVLSLPSLVSVDSIQMSGNELPDLVSLDLPALTDVATDIYVYGCPSLTTINLPALETTGRLYLGYGNNTDDPNPMLATLTLTALESATVVYFNGNSNLTTLSLPALLTTGTLWVEDAAHLVTISAPLWGSGATLFVTDSSQLTQVLFPALETLSIGLWIGGNESFTATSLGLAALTSAVETLYIVLNRKTGSGLTDTVGNALLAQLTVPPTVQATVQNNDPL